MRNIATFFLVERHAVMMDLQDEKLDDSPPLVVVDVIGTLETSLGAPIDHVVAWVKRRLEEGHEVIVWSGLGEVAAQRCIESHGLDGAQAWGKTESRRLFEVASGRTITIIDDVRGLAFPGSSVLLHPDELH